MVYYCWRSEEWTPVLLFGGYSQVFCSHSTSLACLCVGDAAQLTTVIASDVPDITVTVTLVHTHITVTIQITDIIIAARCTQGQVAWNDWLYTTNNMHVLWILRQFVRGFNKIASCDGHCFYVCVANNGMGCTLNNMQHTEMTKRKHKWNVLFRCKQNFLVVFLYYTHTYTWESHIVPVWALRRHCYATRIKIGKWSTGEIGNCAISRLKVTEEKVGG